MLEERLDRIQECINTLVEERDGYIAACVAFASGIAGGETSDQMRSDLSVFNFHNQPKAQAKAAEILNWMIGIYEERKAMDEA